MSRLGYYTAEGRAARAGKHRLDALRKKAADTPEARERSRRALEDALAFVEDLARRTPRGSQARESVSDGHERPADEVPIA